MARGDAAQKARQRARNGTDAGSSMISKRAAGMHRVDWADVEDVAEHVTDLQAIFQSGQIMANRAVTGTLVAGKEWGHEMLDAAMASQGMAVYVRFYVVPMSAVLDEPEEETT
jgi:predicted RNA polymerase sigma factor